MKKSGNVNVTVDIDSKYCGGGYCDFFLFGSYAHNRGDLECYLFGRMLMHDGERALRCEECITKFGMHEAQVNK